MNVGEPFPAEKLDERVDPEWDCVLDEARIEVAMEWAEPLLVAYQAARQMGADPASVEGLTTELYEGLRNRLTRQDLLWVALMYLNETRETLMQAVEIAQRAESELKALNKPRVRQRLLDAS